MEYRGPGGPGGPGDDIVRGRDGRPLTDRYGRPVRRNTQPRHQQQRPQLPPRQQPPRQQPPRQQPPHQARPTRPPRRGEPGYQPPQAKPIRQRKKRSLPGCGCFALPLVAVLVLALVTTLWLDTRLTRTEALPDDSLAPNTSGTNWLLVGSDSREGLTDDDVERLGTGGDMGVGRADTMMLLHIPRSGKATLVSLPRDSYVEVPGYGMDKLNAAFSIGGPQLLTQTVEQATGLRVNHYAEIGMGGLANAVDAVGGVEVCPPEPIVDPLAQLDIPAGCQELDGPTSLGYVRTRATSMGDLDRVERQREFFAALLKETTSLGTVANPFQLGPLVTRLTASFTVNDGDHIWNLARLALAMRGGVDTETVPFSGFADYDVGNVVLWDEAGAQELFSRLS